MSHPHVGIWVTGALSVSILGGLAYFWNLNHVQRGSVVHGHRHGTVTGQQPKHGHGTRQRQRQKGQHTKPKTRHSTSPTASIVVTTPTLAGTVGKSKELEQDANDFLTRRTFKTPTFIFLQIKGYKDTDCYNMRPGVFSCPHQCRFIDGGVAHPENGLCRPSD